MIEKLPRSYEPVQNVMVMLQRCHARVAAICRDAADTPGETKIGMMLQSLARHQQDLSDFMASSQVEAEEKVLTTWLQFVPNEWIEETLDALEANAGSPQELSNQVAQLQNQIGELLHVLQDESASDDVNEFLQALVDREHATAKQISEAVLGMEDM